MTSQETKNNHSVSLVKMYVEKIPNAIFGKQREKFDFVIILHLFVVISHQF